MDEYSIEVGIFALSAFGLIILANNGFIKLMDEYIKNFNKGKGSNRYLFSFDLVMTYFPMVCIWLLSCFLIHVILNSKICLIKDLVIYYLITIGLLLSLLTPFIYMMIKTIKTSRGFGFFLLICAYLAIFMMGIIIWLNPLAVWFLILSVVFVFIFFSFAK